MYPKLTPEEAAMLVYYAIHYRLDPFLKEVYIINFDGKNEIITAEKVFRQRADENPNFESMEYGIIVRNIKGEIQNRKGTFYLDKNDDPDGKGETLLGAWCEVTTKNHNKFYYDTRLRDNIKYSSKTGEPNKFWKSMPAHMCQKNAIVRALKLAFPNELGGLNTESEMLGLDEQSIQ